MVVLYAARHRIPVPSLARWLLGLGIAATLTANMAQGRSHGLAGVVVAAWLAVSVVGSYELLVWLIRESGTAGGRRSAGQLGDAVACRAAADSAMTAATGAGFPRRSKRNTPDQERQPAARVAGPPAIPASGQCDQAVPKVGAVNDAAVAAYRLSAQAGNPLFGTQAGPDVRTHIPPLGARQNRRRTASSRFRAHLGSGNHHRRPIPVVPRYRTLWDALSEFEP